MRTTIGFTAYLLSAFLALDHHRVIQIVINKNSETLSGFYIGFIYTKRVIKPSFYTCF